MSRDERGLEELEADDELDLYSVHRGQIEWQEQLRKMQKSRVRVQVIDESTSPKRITLKSLDEVKAMRDSGFWRFKAEGFEDGKMTVHVEAKRTR